MSFAAHSGIETPTKDFCYRLICFALIVNSGFFLDPTDTNFGLGFGVSYLPFIISAVALMAAFPKDIRFSKLDISILIFLIIPIIGGFVFADIIADEHFFRLSGLGAVYFISRILFVNDDLFDRFVLIFKYAIGCACFAIVLMLVIWHLGFLTLINQTNQNLFHEEIFLLACLPFLPASTLARQRFLTAVAIFGCVLTLKNTGFVVATLICVTYVWNTARPKNPLNTASQFVILCTLLGFVMLFAWVFLSDILPDGNVTTRMITYNFRLAQFVDSPLFGNGFNLRNTIDVGWGRVSSHSDILDILAGMGVFGLLAFLWPVWVVVRAKYGATPDLIFMKILLISFLMVAALNPILMNPKIVFFYWLTLGALVARVSRSGGKDFDQN